MAENSKKRGPALYSRVGLAAIVAGAFVVGFAIWASVAHSGGGRSAAADVRSPVRPAITLTPTASPSGATSSPAGNSSAATSVAPPASTSAPVVPASTPVASAPPAAAAAMAPTTAKQVTYTVKKGDNLTVIAAWFHQHGYQPIYDWNRTIIGQDPNLILPGQVFIVAVA